MQIFGVASGKGGVGKSTVVANLARWLQSQGKRVGILDADLYGPSIPSLIEIEEGPVQEGERVKPARGEGVEVMSVAFFKANYLAVRAPIANQIITQLTHDVLWDVDILLVDFPPGTGDIQITLLQTLSFDGIIAVTTPQKLSVIDVEKGLYLFQEMETPVVGIVENMSDPLFGSGGGEALALSFGLPLLAKIPIDPKLSQEGRGQEVLFGQIGEALLDVDNGGLPHVEWCGHTLKMTWPDGYMAKLKSSAIQSVCPCAGCSGEKGEETTIIEAHLIGRYAIKLQFDKGCSKGIYPLTLLRRVERCGV